MDETDVDRDEYTAGLAASAEQAEGEDCSLRSPLWNGRSAIVDIFN